MYALENAGSHKGSHAFDLRHPNGGYAGLIIQKADGTFRHFYNDTGTKGSARKFKTWSEVFANVDKRMSALRAKREHRAA